MGAVSTRLGVRWMIVVLVFGLTFIGGLAYLDLVVNSHVYHAFLESVFFAHKGNVKTFDPEMMRINWHATLRAGDVRKIGHKIDSFEKTSVEGLVERLRDILTMKQDDERRRAIAVFAARINAREADNKRTMAELRAMRDSGLEGVPVEFADIDASLDRLKQITDVFAVAAAELEAEPDQVTLHGIQKQFDGLLKAIDARLQTTAATAN